MKSFRSNTQGQFVIIAALLIAALTLSVAVTIHQMSSNRIQLEYKPVDELVLGITSDLERALTYALSNASKQYYSTGDIVAAQNMGNLSLLRWQRSVLAAYPQLGIGLSFPEKASFTFQWNNLADNSGFSHADVPNYGLDVDVYGFRGWVGHSEKYVRLVIDGFTFNNADYSTVNFQITQLVNPGSGAVPIPNLTADDITVLANVTGWASLKGTPSDPQYLGGGNYILLFKNPISGLHPRAVTLVVSTPGDQILVSATVTSSVSVVLQSQKKDPPLEQNNPHIKIKLGQATYTLRYTITDWQNLQPYLSCITDNMSYIFLNWAATGDINIANPYENETNVMANGNGTITAFYGILQNNSSAFKLTITSKLDGSTTDINRGSITFDSSTYNTLPVNNLILTSQVHSIVYSSAAGYTFARWEFSPSFPPWIVLSNDHSNSTGIMLFGNGTLTAIYQQRKILLDSKEYNGTTAHLGEIDLGGYAYAYPNLPATLVPANATVSNGAYNLSFTPSNSSYQFLWWNMSGDIILTGGNASVTTIEILGNGNITAIYQIAENPPPPSSGGTFWVDAHGSKDFWLVSTTPDKNGHLASKASTGSGKANLTVTSDPTVFPIRVAKIVSVTAYIGIQPANSPLRLLEFELGFNYNGSYYRLGYDKFTITGSPNAVYNLYMDTTNDVFPPGEQGVIPQGSTITLSVTATFTTPPGGTIFLFYGPSQPSCITLF